MDSSESNHHDPLEFYDYHHSMVLDKVRTEAFLRAIFNVVKPGDVVVDIGTGTGLLSLFAATAGARRVYAIEQEPIIEVAKQVARVNGVEERIEFLAGKSTEIDLPEAADVLITETIGNAGFDEGIVAWVEDARERMLKRDARIVPRRLSVEIALLELPRDREEYEALSRPVYTFDLSPLQSLVAGRLAWDDLSPVSVVSQPAPVLEWESETRQPAHLAGSCVASAVRDTTVHAVGCWFSAEIGEGIELSNAPPNATPSWNQGVVMLEKPLELVAAEQVGMEVEFAKDGSSFVCSIETI